MYVNDSAAVVAVNSDADVDDVRRYHDHVRYLEGGEEMSCDVITKQDSALAVLCSFLFTSC